MKTAFITTFTIALIVLPVSCQVPSERQSEPFVFDAGAHEVPALVDRVAAYLGYDILYDVSELQAGRPGEAAAQIRLTRRTEVDRKGCWEVASSLLHAHGYAILPLDPSHGFFELVAMNGPRGGEVASRFLYVEESRIEEFAGDCATPVLTTVKLRNINANIATNALRPFFANAGSTRSSGLTFGTAGNNSALLVQGFGSQVYHAVQLVRQVDRPVEEVEVVTQVRRLEHTAPEDVEPILTQLLDSRIRIRMQALMEAGAMGAGPNVTSFTGKVVVVPTLGALALTGTAAEVDEALGMIAQLDVASNVPRRASEDQGKRIQQLEERIKVLEQGARPEK